jgi:hypothetical protein
LVGRDSRLRDKFIQPDVHLHDALAGWKRVLARHQRDDLRLELKSAELEYGKNPNQVTWERLQKMRSMMLQMETQDAMDMDGRNYSA